MSKLRDGIYGLAIADALGVPFEFKKRGTSPAQAWLVLELGIKLLGPGLMIPA